ncbi:hypothetical protein RhiirB3_430893 [Rhizophagus irregularis]|nr:hypothetical protein RhiirB3_430893 [Rhizophagus irregularis]
MSCSKIFSGDLPELIYEIIKYFKTDHSTLHSCILVNRLWCRLAIPLLWENPFSISTKNYNFIEIYLHDLNDDLKTKYNISTSNTLFNYSKFIKYLNIEEFISSVKNWSVRSSLFKIFIENEIELHSLDIEIFNHSFNFDYILELILQNTNFIQNIKNLNLYINHNIKDMVIKDRVIQIVNLQQNLKKILLYNSSFSLYQSLLLSNKIFDQLNVLESIHLAYYGESLELLLQKSGDYLENFGHFLSKRHLLDIIKYCKNIKLLDLENIENQTIYLILDLVENIKQNLNYLSINIDIDNIECSSIMLQNLGQILPSKLEYLCLNIYHIKTSDFEDILPYIKKYIMKRQRIKYLAILTENNDLFYLKDEVKEFKLHDIRVRKFSDLFIDTYYHLKNV